MTPPPPPPPINATTARYCYLDLDLEGHRHQLAVAAAFVAATDTRYGFSSSNLLELGGSEVARIPDLLAGDHEWAARAAASAGVQVKPPVAGNRMVVELHWEIAPLACENFATLCANGSTTTTGHTATAKKSTARRPAPTGACGKPLTYRGSAVHRIVPGFILQGGDFVFGNGSGGESVFNGGKKFKDERAGLLQKHDRRGILSMGNSGKHSNSSQWFLTLAAAPQCDGRHVVFGELVSGWEVLAAAEALGSSTAGGAPTAPAVVVTDCGLWNPQTAPGAGFWYDPPDPEALAGASPAFVARPRVATVAPTAAARDKFRQALAAHHALQTELVCGSGGMNDESSPPAENSATTVAQQLLQLLQKCAVDVIVVAPACPIDALTAILKNKWQTLQRGDRELQQRSLDKVLLTAKPLEAASAIRTKSWLAEQSQWQFDGLSS